MTPTHALLVDYNNGERAVIDPSEMDYVTHLEPVEVARLFCDASFDHSLRTADETALVIGCEAAALVLESFALLAGWRVDFYSLDVTAIALDELNIGWNGDGWSEESEVVFDWSEEMTDLAGSAGWIVESDADCGMTWFYRPIPS